MVDEENRVMMCHAMSTSMCHCMLAKMTCHAMSVIVRSTEKWPMVDGRVGRMRSVFISQQE
jgi:hypothetical protein